MRKIVLLSISLLCFGYSHCQELTVAEIVDKHIESMGGMDSINATTSLVYHRSAETKDFKSRQVYTIIPERSIRIDGLAFGQKSVMCYNGDEESGWQINPFSGSAAPKVMDEKAVGYLKFQTAPFGQLVNYEEKGIKISLVGVEKISRKKSAYHLKLKYPTEYEESVFLDKETFRLEKIVGAYGETYFSDYTEIKGRSFPNTIEMISKNGNMLITTQKILVNEAIDKSLFSMPGTR